MKSPQKNKQSAVKNKTVKKQAVQTEKKQPKAYNEELSEAFIREVNEEVQNDNLKVLWNKYGLFIILFVVLAVFAAVSFETIKEWRNSKLQAQTDEYLAAVQGTENVETTLLALEKIAGGNHGKYSELARIQIANVLFENNRTDEAISTLETMVADEELNPKISHLAALKLATYKIDTASSEEIENLLLPVVQSGDSWAPLAQEMLAMTAIREGNIEQARAYYGELLQNPKISSNFKNRIEDMLSSLNEIE